tara:strand:- start:3938 stop:4201 length:264 start_codon:yes stop_codon:yes gene_type:complete
MRPKSVSDLTNDLSTKKLTNPQHIKHIITFNIKSWAFRNRNKKIFNNSKDETISCKYFTKTILDIDVLGLMSTEKIKIKFITKIINM